MAVPNPSNPHYIDILSCTYGGFDFSQFLRDTYVAVYASQPNLQVWNFPVGNTFFRTDPNPSLLKVATIVYRFKIANPSGPGVVWSNYQATCAAEGGQVELDASGANQSPAPPEPSPSVGRFVVKAFWWMTDVTAQVQKQLENAPFVPGQGSTITVGPDALGSDPIYGTVKECAVTYATYMNGWVYDVAVGMQAPATWYLSLPPMFPPPRRPRLRDEITFVTFENKSSTGLDLYPRIYTEDGAIFWDGQASGFVIHAGFVADIGGRTTVALDIDLLAISVSSAMAEPAKITWTSGADNQATITHDFLPQSTQCQYYPEDLRLNIYSASWGSADYTSFVRQQYVTSTILTPPTSTTNTFSFVAQNPYFGPDPDYGVGKACVLVYRVAYCIGHTRGAITNPSDPPVWDPAYQTADIQPTYTDRYPVLQDIGQFRSRSCQEWGTITIDLLKEDLTPIVDWPAANALFTARAVYSTRDVTPLTASLLTPQWTAGGSGDMTLTISPDQFGGDPWPNNNNQFTLLVGYPIAPAKRSYSWRTIIGYDVAKKGTFAVAVPRSAGVPGPQAPTAFLSHEAPTYNVVNFRNFTGLTVWPEVCVNSNVVWDGREMYGDWAVGSGQSKTVRLIDDAYCTEGQSYTVTFNCASFTMPPATAWVCASKSPRYTLTLTYVPRALSVPEEYDIIRETVAAVGA